MQSIIEIIPVLGLGGIIGGLITNWINHKHEQNSENKRRIRELREKQYKDFLNNLMGFYKGWEDKNRQKQFIWDVNTNATVSASDEVYRLARNYINSYDKIKKVNEEERQKIYAKLVITMRNELSKMSGEKPTTLKEDEIRVMQLDEI